MAKFITKYPLSRFEELIPLLMRCFPEFWEPRLKQGLRSFPYDLTLFSAKLEGEIIGCIGAHDYPFLLGNRVIECCGVSDVAVDPDHRGKGYALELQKFIMNHCRQKTLSGFLPLYTEKPDVYQRMGWRIYESSRSDEIRSKDFPKGKTFRLDPGKLRLAFLRGKGKARTEEELIAGTVMTIYDQGRTFPGKCVRSGKTWWELFADPEYEWQLEGNTYFLYRGDDLYEAYSSDRTHEVSKFTPKHGGHDANKVMINFVKNNQTKGEIAAAVNDKTLIFPAADVF